MRGAQLLEALEEFGTFGVHDRALPVFMGGEQRVLPKSNPRSE